MNLFESMRRANIDFYTANPLAFLSDEQLQELAQYNGMTVEELKQHLSTSHPEMTCPLCGRPSTHLVMCKGCGSDSWGYELELAHSADAIQRLRDGLAVTLQTQPKPPGIELNPEQVQYAVSHAYQSGGCMLCADCWHHTLPADAYAICPLYLHAERFLETTRQVPFLSLFLAVLHGEQPREWMRRIFIHWTQSWNTAGETPAATQAIAIWRSLLLHSALGRPAEFTRHTVDVAAEIRSILHQIEESGNLFRL
jgi:hypothetical protein